MYKPYERKLSTTEVSEGFIMISKDRVRYFPPTGTQFTLIVNGKEYQTAISEIPCTCRGPDKPHVHWHLDASGFRNLFPDNRPAIKITKTEEKAYHLEIAGLAN